MNPVQIQEMLRSRNPEQIREAQKQLKSLGLYKGKIDGSLGRKPDESETVRALQQYQLQYTRQLEEEASQRAAAERERADRLESERLANERLSLEQSGKTQAVQNEAQTLANERARIYQEQASSPEGIATQSAANIAAPALTTSLGYYAGGKLNERLDKGQAKRNVVLQGTAEDRVRGLTTREGANTGARLSGTMPLRNPAMRAASRMAPHLGLAGLAGIKAYDLLTDDTEKPFYAEQADRAAGLGYLGFGGGLAKRGIEYSVSPGTPPDAKALSVINSTQLRRGGPAQASAQQSLPAASAPPPQSRPAAPPPSQSQAPIPTNAQTLIAAAREAGAEGKLTKSSAAKYIRDNITDGNRASVARALRVKPGPNFAERIGKKIQGLSSSRKTLPGVMFPFSVAALAYGLTPERASASEGGEASVDQGEALTNAGIAGGLTYGIGSLLPAGTMSLTGGMMAPLAAMNDPLEGGSREETAQNISEARGQASSVAPWMAENIMGIPRAEGELYSKAQVPPRNPTRGIPEGADPDVAKAWRKSPRRTIIELSRSSGLDAQDIATLAGVAPDEVVSIMDAIPQRAMEMSVSP